LLRIGITPYSCILRSSSQANFQGTQFPQVVFVVDVLDEPWVKAALMAVDYENRDGAASNLWKEVNLIKIQVGPPGWNFLDPRLWAISISPSLPQMGFTLASRPVRHS